MLQPFHVAVPVDDLEAARLFYTKVLGCKVGRSSKLWIDIDFFGHQYVVHYKEKNQDNIKSSNPVDGHEVPIPHYGVVLKWEDWEVLAKKLKDMAISFIIEPHIRFEGKVGEQATMFFNDPAGNALEFKAFKDLSQLFAK